jgi:hypothetical protein
MSHRPQGDSVEEALDMIKDAIEGHLQVKEELEREVHRKGGLLNITDFHNLAGRRIFKFTLEFETLCL